MKKNKVEGKQRKMYGRNMMTQGLPGSMYQKYMLVTNHKNKIFTNFKYSGKSSALVRYIPNIQNLQI